MSDLLPRTLLRTGAYLLLLGALCFTFQGGNLAILLFRADDLPVLAIAALVLIALAWLRPALPRLPRAVPAWVVGAAAIQKIITREPG